MLVALIFANVAQALSTRSVQGEGGVATVAALLGLKPLVEGFNIIFGNEDDARRGRFDPVTNFAISRLFRDWLSSPSRKRSCSRSRSPI